MLPTPRRISRHEAIAALVAAYDQQKPRGDVRYPDHSVRLPAPRWAEIVAALRTAV